VLTKQSNVKGELHVMFSGKGHNMAAAAAAAKAAAIGRTCAHLFAG